MKGVLIFNTAIVRLSLLLRYMILEGTDPRLMRDQLCAGNSILGGMAVVPTLERDYQVLTRTGPLTDLSVKEYEAGETSTQSILVRHVSIVVHLKQVKHFAG
jgi:hypothetical protein